MTSPYLLFHLLRVLLLHPLLFWFCEPPPSTVVFSPDLWASYAPCIGISYFPPESRVAFTTEEDNMLWLCEVLRRG